MGGLHVDLRDAVGDSLKRAGFSTSTDHHMHGKHPNNICNRGRLGAGVLLRLVAPLLGAHYSLGLSLSAIAWCGAFGGFVLFYYRPRTGPRVGLEGAPPI
jgi:hypothetical protein